ncbi:phage antirepressor KilAC domain-containing protein [Lactobacillus crispatus]|uniref:phage antirepressor KilAC domain-containing protein n=1 Tax=Lactobacillus crispatus TaxID=47770 RepID=UPI00336A77A9
MQELIKVQVHNDRQLVSARDLHEGLGLKKKFTNWWKQNNKDFEENVDYTTSPKSHVVQSGNGTVRRYDDYALTIDMAKQLCLMSRTEKGKQYRKYLIEVERKWNNPQEIVKRGYAILQNENTRLKLENKQMKPKALFADAVATSKNDILIGQLAKILRQNGYETGQNRLLKWLREHHYLCSKGLKYNQPTQKAMELGLFRVKERTVNNPDGSSRITVTTKVTGKGQQYFINRLLSSEPTQLSLEIEGV